MLGQMQEWPLRIHKIIDFAATQHPKREIVSRLVEGPIHRTDYREMRARSLKLAQRLAREAMFLLVWSCPNAVIDCTVDLLTK